MSEPLVYIATAVVTHRHGTNSYLAAGVSEQEAKSGLLKVVRDEFCDAWWETESQQLGRDSSAGLDDQAAVDWYFEAMDDESYNSGVSTMLAADMLKLTQRALATTHESAV